MKKLVLLLVFLPFLQNCSKESVKKEDVLSKVYEIRVVNFVKNTNGDYKEYFNFPVELGPNDMVITYRRYPSDPLYYTALAVSFNSGTGTVFYYANFSTKILEIGASPSSEEVFSPDYKNNQFFRAVVVPANLTNKSKSGNKLNFIDYNALIKAYNIDDSNPIILK
jgi:NAD-specific glutamate dehydrogenase